MRPVAECGMLRQLRSLPHAPLPGPPRPCRQPQPGTSMCAPMPGPLSPGCRLHRMCLPRQGGSPSRAKLMPSTGSGSSGGTSSTGRSTDQLPSEWPEGKGGGERSACSVAVRCVAHAKAAGSWRTRSTCPGMDGQAAAAPVPAPAHPFAHRTGTCCPAPGCMPPTAPWNLHTGRGSDGGGVGGAGRGVPTGCRTAFPAAGPAACKPSDNAPKSSLALRAHRSVGKSACYQHHGCCTEMTDTSCQPRTVYEGQQEAFPPHFVVIVNGLQQQRCWWWVQAASAPPPARPGSLRKGSRAWRGGSAVQRWPFCSAPWLPEPDSSWRL